MIWKCRGCKHIKWVHHDNYVEQHCEYEYMFYDLENVYDELLDAIITVNEKVLKHKDKCPFWELEE